jgi:hypothetical protein
MLPFCQCPLGRLKTLASGTVAVNGYHIPAQIYGVTCKRYDSLDDDSEVRLFITLIIVDVHFLVKSESDDISAPQRPFTSDDQQAIVDVKSRPHRL